MAPSNMLYFHCLLRVMIHIVAQCHEEGLEHYLRSYVKVEFPSHIKRLNIYLLYLHS